jgi:hypothetical protein
LSGSSIGVVYDTPINIALNGGLSCGSINIFDYGFKNAGNDTITDFTLGNTTTNTNADILNLSDLLIGYSATSHLSDFVTAAADGAHTKLTIDHDGTGVC